MKRHTCGTNLALKTSTSLDAFKRSLLATNVIVLSDPKIGATTNAYFMRMLERLGIADQMKAKVKFVSDAHTADYVAKGEAEIAVQLGNELLAVPGIEFVPLPTEFQTKDFIFSAGIATNAKEAEASRVLIQFSESNFKFRRGATPKYLILLGAMETPVAQVFPGPAPRFDVKSLLRQKNSCSIIVGSHGGKH